MPGEARGAVRRPAPRGAGGRSRHARRAAIPSDVFAELRPRLTWDRTTQRLAPRPNAQRLAVTSGGTIPDRGLYGVFLVGEQPTRVGELDEEMVYESRVGEVFLLGASSWRIEDITHDRVLVSPAPGQPGKMPFWHGDAPGRPLELGAAIGRFVRGLVEDADPRRARCASVGLDEWAADNLVRYLAEQREATGAVPDDRTIVVERFRDAVGDWRVCVHSFFGAKVHAPWARAIEARLRQRLGIAVQSMYTDDGIVIRVPDADEAPPADASLLRPRGGGGAGRRRRWATRRCSPAASASARRARCCFRGAVPARARRSGSSGSAAPRCSRWRAGIRRSRSCSRPTASACRTSSTCPRWSELLSAVRRREVRVVEVDTALPSPFAGSLQFGYVSAFMYEGDAPLAERRAQALSLDRSLLAELMGTSRAARAARPGRTRRRSSSSFSVSTATARRVTCDERARSAARAGRPDAGRGRCARRAATNRRLARRAGARRAARCASALHGEERWIAVEDAGR